MNSPLTTQVPTAAPAPQTNPPLTSAPPATTTATAAPAAIMPDVVCANLQDAQNTIQKAGVFYSRSKDATGAGRMQVMDRNWIVVAQSPAPGTPFTEGEAVLSVVKYGEPNQCR
ncbi:PASTA domain-containing protein [Nocardia jejuensis]|uniref:PASTA domain-containing protein n=1 Tax=Nocardia jejuensis TaxID=328049 RepID=UPI000B2B2D69|nr:PASTA domain-containing protein [Nocardia jejuensis]